MKSGYYLSKEDLIYFIFGRLPRSDITLTFSLSFCEVDKRCCVDYCVHAGGSISSSFSNLALQV